VETVINWFNSYWWVILIAITLVMKILNVASSHFSENTGFKKWALFLVDVLDIFKVTPAPKKGDK
jgi:hypothetical protein